MSKVIRYTRGDLGNIGHQSLTEILARKPVRQLTIQQAIGVGLLATLLLIAEDISALRGMYNTMTMLEDYHVDQ